MICYCGIQPGTPTGKKLLIGNTDQYSNASLSLSGGNADTRYRIGGTYNRQTTVFPGDYSDVKISGYFNLTQQSLNKKFHAQFSAQYTNDNSNLPGTDLTGQALSLAPDAPALYSADGNLNWELYNNTATWNNPLAYTEIHAISKTNNLITSLNLRYEILPDLKLSGNFGYVDQQMNQNTLIPGSSLPPPTQNVNPNRRRNFLAYTTASNWNIEPQLTYEKKIGMSKFSALIGTTFRENNNNSNAYLASGFSNDALINYPAAAATIHAIGDENSLYHYNAVYGQLGYNYGDEYLLNLTARRDGSSRFGPGKQFGNFGAIGVGWVFTKEKFIQEAIPMVKFW